jgi:hypothetical protein
MPTFNQATVEADTIDPAVPAIFGHLEAYRMTNATGAAVDNIAGISPGFDVSNVTNARDFIQLGVQTGAGTTAGGAGMEDGTHDFWVNGQTVTAPVLEVNDDGILRVTAPRIHRARPTLQPTAVNNNGINVTNGVMTLTQWEEAGRPTGNFWILDTENPGGWFYWASPLPRYTATSLLLDEITIGDQTDDWEYVTSATADFVTRAEIDSLTGISADAREIWED